ncbi:MHF histone-fold complex component [Elasticomyces elasticus]|nr:MHF histone-fold complex component [Elasticomyces elasticus]KAK4984547.1 MHF histone-fold complex component [Elasticomyces elasticus]
MPGLQEDDADKVERLKAALWYSVGQAVDTASLNLSLNATPQFIGALTEMLWNQIDTAGKDLEAFANHAGRKVINTDDVLLLARRNDSLKDMLQDYAQTLQPPQPKPTNKRKR